MSLNGGAYFGGLSISSLASEDKSDSISDAETIETHVELYRRLQELEEMTSNYLMSKPLLLNHEHDSFAEIEIGHVQEFELRIPPLSAGDVLTLTVSCIPDFVSDTLDLAGAFGSHQAVADHQTLHIELVRNPITHDPLMKVNIGQYAQHRSIADSNISTFTPKLHNGEYSFALTPGHGLTSGSYMLKVSNSQNASNTSQKVYQLIRVSHKIHSSVRATTLDDGKTIFGRVGMNDTVYYRCTSYFSLLILSAITLSFQI